MGIIWIVYGLFAALAYYALNGKKGIRYRSWYRPWLVLIAVLIYLTYYKKILGITDYLGKEAILMGELAFAAIFFIVWFFIKAVLKSMKIDEILFKLLRKYNVDKVAERKRGYANYLLWPYVIQNFQIKFRNGHKYFKFLFWAAGIILLAASIWTTYMNEKTFLVLPTLLTLLAIPVFMEWIIYFNWQSSIDPEEAAATEETQKESGFYNLYKRYLDSRNGFYESWISGYFRTIPEEKTADADRNAEYLQNYMARVKTENTDLIIGSDNFTDIVPEISELLLKTIENGGNILMIADIPNHTSYQPSAVGISHENNELKSITHLFAIYLRQVLAHRIPAAGNLIDIGYYSIRDNSGLNKRIVICSAEDALSKELIHSDWMKEMDLEIVFQFNDSLANNLGLKRQLSLWLKQQNRNYKTLFLKHYSTGGDEATSNTWISSKDVPEVNLQNIQTAYSNYFVNFAYEYSIENLNKILIGNVFEFDLAPGIELSVFPIMEDIEHIHYFEGYNLDYIQSKNKLENLQKSFSPGNGTPEDGLNYLHNATQAKLLNAILVNNLPFIVHPFGQPECNDEHMSVVYDSINNAPKLYQKYMHLGKNESFVCIVSKPHLMREYFAENINYFTASTIEPFEPLLSKSKINLCLELLNLLVNEKIDIAFIQSLINNHSIDLGNRSIIEFIRDLFRQYLYLDISKSAVLKSDSSYVFRNNEYYHLHSLSMDRQKLEINDIFEYLHKVKVKDASGNVILEIPKYLLFQNFLPQQNIIIDGISYDYIQYSDLNRELVLRTKPTDNFSFNKPEAVINLSSNTKIEEIDSSENTGFFVSGKLHEFSSVIKEAEIEIYYSNYFKFNRFYHSPFSRKQTPQFVDLMQFDKLIENSVRKYNTRFLHIKWEVPEKYRERLPELTTRIHHLLYEFMPILFPHRNQYLQIASDNTQDERHREKTPWIFPKNNFEYNAENCIELYIIEDSFTDLGILKPIQNFFEKILIDLYLYLTWLNDTSATVSPPYLQSHRNPKFFKEKLTFLKYGLTANQIKWDIDFLIEFLEESKLIDPSSIGTGYKSNTRPVKKTQESKAQTQQVKNPKVIIEEQTQPDPDTQLDAFTHVSKVECDYCAVEFNMSELSVMEDGLHRCKSCAEDAIDTLPQAEELLKIAYYLFKKVANVDFNTLEVNFNFVTATELHHRIGMPFEVTNKYDRRSRSANVLNEIYIEKNMKRLSTLSSIIKELTNLYMYQKLDYMKVKYAEEKLTTGLPIYAMYMLMKNSSDTELENFAIGYKNTIDKTENPLSQGIRYVIQTYNGPSFLTAVTKRYGK